MGVERRGGPQIAGLANWMKDGGHLLKWVLIKEEPKAGFQQKVYSVQEWFSAKDLFRHSFTSKKKV